MNQIHKALNDGNLYLKVIDVTCGPEQEKSVQQRVYTCIQFPPVDATEKGVRSELVTVSILKTHPLINLFSQQPITEGLCILTETL